MVNKVATTLVLGDMRRDGPKQQSVQAVIALKSS